jgi:amino acid transporter
MESITKKKLISFALCLSICSFALLPTLALGQFGLDEMTELEISTNASTNLTSMIVGVINVVLGFLGVIAVVIILFAGFKWMTAAGSEEKVKDAETMIIQAIMGLVVIFLAWVIANFVISGLMTATGIES